MDLQTWTYNCCWNNICLYNGIVVPQQELKNFMLLRRISPLCKWYGNAADRMSAAFWLYGWNHFDGYDGAVYLMGWTAGYFYFATRTYLRKSEIYCSGLRTLLNSANGCNCLCFSGFFTYVAGQMRGVGLFSKFFRSRH
jgi:Na+(H+)/acetate symporter ActP